MGLRAEGTTGISFDGEYFQNQVIRNIFDSIIKLKQKQMQMENEINELQAKLMELSKC